MSTNDTIFSDSFRALAYRLGITNLDEYYESRYLEYASKRLFRTKIYKRYLTGRGRSPEDVRDVLLFYNDLKTRPSQKTIEEAREFFLKAVEGHTEESAKVKQLARFIERHGRYTADKQKFGTGEYWCSPFDLYAEWKQNGYFRDDCDGYAVLLWWACVLIGVPRERVAVWAGLAVRGLQSEGHANVVYNDLDREPFHVEGTFYFDENQRNWGAYKHGRTKRYPATWFYFNDEKVANV